jgi:hypothetical protein
MKATSPKNFIMLVNGFPLTNFGEGSSAIKIAMREDAVTDKVGMDGKMSISISANQTAEVTATLMQTSDANKFLLALVHAQTGGPATFVPVNVMFQDTYRQDVGIGTHGYIKKLPDIERGDEVAEQEWVFVVERLDLALGAPAFAGLATMLAENG